MKILFLGDVVGRSGRQIVREQTTQLRQLYNIDFVICNAENSAHGFGITPEIAKQLLNAGVDVLTTGNHVWDRPEIIDFFKHEKRILRPHNMTTQISNVSTNADNVNVSTNVGSGVGVYSLSYKQQTTKIMVVNIIGNLLMKKEYTDPFVCLNDILPPGNPQQHGYMAIVVDFHAEATSEKQALAYNADGRCSLLAGTHTHVPTQDYRILPKQSAFITDVGMCGDYESIIGMDVENSLTRFLNTHTKPKALKPATLNATLSGVIVEIYEESGLAKSIKPLILGHTLANTNLSNDY